MDGARRDLDGAEIGVSVYASTAFRFGQPRGDVGSESARVVIETWPSDSDEPAQRVSLSLGEALHLARILHVADDLTFVSRAA